MTMQDIQGDHKERMRKIKDEVLALGDSISHSPDGEMPLPLLRKKNGVFPVIGEGSHFAKIMFIGEAPGKNEAATGRPFCGAAGRILDELFASVGMRRDDAYITNIVKDRPPMNRDPLPEEIALYAPFLDRQIDIIEPKAIVTLGRFSMDYIFKKFNLENLLGPISLMHGKVFEVAASYGKIKVIPLYHPAVAIYNPHSKGELVKDFALLKGI